MMPHNNGGDKENAKERKIRDMLGLVKFCLESTAKEDPSERTNFEPMDEDRRAWLQNAISSMTVDVTQQLLENLSLVKETINEIEKNPTSLNIPVQKTCTAIGVLTDLCEDLDYANDFAKLAGFTIFKPLIGCQHEELIVKACELIAALSQNNPLCQTMAMNMGIVSALIDFVETKGSHSHIKARSYALYAISSIIRSNQEVRTYFETRLDGLSVLLHLLDYQTLDQMLDTSGPNLHPTKKSGSTSSNMSGSIELDSKSSAFYWWRKMRIRTVFLFRTLCTESETASRFFYEKQAIKQVTEQLKNYQDPEIREHLLNALKAHLCSLDSKEKQIESLKLTPNLREIVEQLHHQATLPQSSLDYDTTDIKSTCKELITLIDSLQAQKK